MNIERYDKYSYPVQHNNLTKDTKIDNIDSQPKEDLKLSFTVQPIKGSPILFATFFQYEIRLSYEIKLERPWNVETLARHLVCLHSQYEYQIKKIYELTFSKNYSKVLEL